MGVKVRFIARRVAVLAVIALPFAAMAQLLPEGPPPRVALLNVALDQQAGQLAVRALRKALLADDQFDPLQPGPLANVLELALNLDPDAEIDAAIARADDLLNQAEEAYTNLREKEAEELLRAAERELVSIEPRSKVIQRLAEINFRLGLVLMRRQDSVSAAGAFRVAMRLSPDRPAPDPGVYDPDVIKAYEAAASLSQAKTATVEVIAPFDGADVYIDGKKVGVTPYRASVEPGLHYFWGTMPDKQPFGARLTAIVYEERELSLQIRRIPDDRIAARMRAELLRNGARDEARLSAAVATIYQLTLVKFVAVVTQHKDKGLQVAIFDPTGRRLTEWAELSPESAEDVIKALPGRVDLDPDKLPPLADAGAGGLGNGKPKGRPWYREPLSYVAIGGVTVIAVAGFLILSGSDQGVTEFIDGRCCEPFEQ